MMALAVSDVAYWRKCEAPQSPLFGSYLPGRSMLIWLTCEGRDAEVSDCAPHFRLLDYSRPTRHVPGTSKMTQLGLKHTGLISMFRFAPLTALITGKSW